jgi:hypothetical protein
VVTPGRCRVAGGLSRALFPSVFIAVALLLAVSASPAAASVTIGQTGANSSTCISNADWLQPTVTGGNTYVAPGTGTITSWAVDSTGSAGQVLTMKMYRQAGNSTTYQVVGHAGPQTLTSAGPAGNTFPASIRVKPGDVLGFHTVSSPVPCAFPAPGEQWLIAPSDLADGAQGPFTFVTTDNDRLNIQANFVPDNTLSLGGITRNKKKGTATVTENVPNAGDLTGSGNGAKVASGAEARISKAVTPGPAQLLIKAKGKKKRKLNETGKVKLNVAVTYTPTGGDPSTQSLKVKLKKNL